MQMIERVAKAIWDSGFDRVPDPAWEQTSHLQKEFHRMLARAAIEAMREPSYEMIRAFGVGSQTGFTNDTERSHAWSAMIDAALTPATNSAADHVA